MKVVRIQLDITYEVPDEFVEQYMELDDSFFNSVGDAFWNWPNNPGEVRVPVQFDYRATPGEVKEENDEVPESEL